MPGVLIRSPGRVSDEVPPPRPREPHEGGDGGGEWALLTVARNLVVAHLIQGRLAQEGIEVVLDASNASPGAWLHPFGDPTSPVKVFVRRTDLSAASLMLYEVDQPTAVSGPGWAGPSDGDRRRRAGTGGAFLSRVRAGPGPLRTLFRVLVALAAALALSGLLLFGPCVSRWFCV
jgi:hypothetical protein